jgi:hypothetical protein
MDSTIKWLLDGDPSIVYQTKRDLLDVPIGQLEKLQNQIATAGWGARLLSYQDRSGRWGGGLYGPKWISTHYTLLTLMQLGLKPSNAQAQRGCKLLLEAGFHEDGGINHFVGSRPSDTCVTAMTLSLLCYFGIDDQRIETLLDFIAREQMPDGGWNCEKYQGATHSSFHTIICALEAIGQYVQRTGNQNARISNMKRLAHDFLLCHHLFKSDKTGKIVNSAMTRFSFPPRWKYDVLRSLDYFQSINAPHDPRFCDAITLLRKKQKNGKWPQQQKYAGRTFFDMEPVGQAGRMNTLRALRILKWWNLSPKNECY